MGTFCERRDPVATGIRGFLRVQKGGKQGRAPTSRLASQLPHRGQLRLHPAKGHSFLPPFCTRREPRIPVATGPRLKLLAHCAAWL